MRSPRKSSTTSSTSCSWWKFSSQKNGARTEYNMQIQKNWNEEIQNTHHLSHGASLTLKGDKNGNHSDQAQRERNCVADRGWRTIFIKNAMQEVAEKLKNWKDPAIRKEITKKKKQRRFKEYPAQHDQESRTVSLFFQDPDSPSSFGSVHVSHQALITSSSRKPSREVGMPRNTREIMSIPGNVFDRQHARRDPDELHNDSRDLATLSWIADDVEDCEKKKEFWERRTIAINTFTLLFSKSEERKSRRQMSLMSMTDTMPWVCGLALKWHDNSELSHLGDASSKFLDQTEFQSWIVNFQVEVEATSSLKDLISPKSSTEKDFSDYEEIGFDNGGRIEMMLQYCLFDLRIYRA